MPGGPTCPLCRASVATIAPAAAVIAILTSTAAVCTCGVAVHLLSARRHTAVCAHASRAAAAATAALARGRIITGTGPAAVVLAAARLPVGPNRVTFACPLCPEDPFGRSANMDCTALVEHVAQQHPGDRRPALCTVCAVMPWGSSAYISRDWAAHVQLRHRFEYATFVDFEVDERVALARVLAASAQEAGVEAEAASDSEEDEAPALADD